MLKFPMVNGDVKTTRLTGKLSTDTFALDGAELIPVDCGGRLLTPTISVNELGKHLLKAASEGNVEETKALLNRGALFTADWLGTSPLHLAARNNHLEVCEILLRAGISKDARTKVDKTALHVAASEGHVSIVETLLECGAEPNCTDLLGMTPLHWAAQNGHLNVVRALVAYLDQTNPLNKFDLTPADVAAQINRLDIIEAINASRSNPADDASTLTSQLTLNFIEDDDDDDEFRDCDDDSTSNSPIPLGNFAEIGKLSENFPVEAILHEDGDSLSRSDGGIPDAVNNGDIAMEDVSDNQANATFEESIRLLQEHGITMLSNDENNDFFTTVLENGHSVVLTDVGKQLLKESELDPPPIKKKIITMTPEEFLDMTTSLNTNKSKILRQINGRLVPRNVKRIVMKKNKVIPVSTVNNICKIERPRSSTDMETVMTQLIEARKTIEDYKIRLFKKEQEVEWFRQQLKRFTEVS